MKGSLFSLLLGSLLFAAMPASTNYGLHNYGFGSGGTSNSTSANYKLNATTGETSNTQSSSSTYKARSGENNTQQANVPAAPTFTNPSSYYDKLHFVINPGGTSPTDTKYSIAISTDNFTTTNYVQPDDTVGSSNGIGAYQTYSAWGGSSGQNIIGLLPNTTYQIKVNAIQGTFTQTEYGPSASASTVNPNLTFSMYTDSQGVGTGPFSTSFGKLLPATVTTAADKVWINLATNGDSGANVYISSANSGLHSNTAGNTIVSATADLSSAGTGYGAQGYSVTQTSGGPLTMQSPYNGVSQNVGVLNTYLTRLYSSSAPITGGNAAFQLMAKAAATTPESSDYLDTLTLTAAGVY